jgi:hypothetical protein
MRGGVYFLYICFVRKYLIGKPIEFLVFVINSCIVTTMKFADDTNAMVFQVAALAVPDVAVLT